MVQLPPHCNQRLHTHSCLFSRLLQFLLGIPLGLEFVNSGVIHPSKVLRLGKLKGHAFSLPGGRSSICYCIGV